MNNPVRFALVGLGARGRYWRTVLEREPRAQAVAFVDPQSAQREAFEQLEPGVPTFGDLGAALRSIGVDAIVLATPPETRAPHLTLAFANGLPVLVEKPLSLDLQEAARFVQEAKAAGVPLMVGLNFRYLDVTKKTRRLIEDGTVGTPEFARFTYERWRDGVRPGLNRYPLTMEHPMLWEQSIHHVDLMRYVFEDEPTSVYAKTYNPSWTMYSGDTNVSAVFTFRSGRVVNYHGTWQANHATPHFEWRTECSKGTLFQRDQFGELSYALRHDERPTKVELKEHEVWVSDTAGVLSAFLDHLVNQAFLECSGLDHLRSLAMIEACVRSSRTGHSQSVPAIMDELLAPLSSGTHDAVIEAGRSI